VPRGQLSAEEEAAGGIVAQQLGGTHQPRDVPGAPDGTHDLDVHADGRTIALEVTSAGDRAVEKLREQLFGETWEAPSLHHHWWLGIAKRDAPRPGRVSALMQHIVPHLEILERHRVHQVSDVDPATLGNAPPEVSQAAQAIFQLGVHRVTQIDRPKPGETARLLSSLSGGLSAGPDSLNGIVEARAQEKADKLRAADGTEKHVFVWLRAAAHDEVDLALATHPLPSEPPTLPEGIDVAWVGIGPADPSAPTLALWCIRPPRSWEQVRAPHPLAGG
jgi:hypothetical protein